MVSLCVSSCLYLCASVILCLAVYQIDWCGWALNPARFYASHKSWTRDVRPRNSKKESERNVCVCVTYKAIRKFDQSTNNDRIYAPPHAHNQFLTPTENMNFQMWKSWNTYNERNHLICMHIALAHASAYNRKRKLFINAQMFVLFIWFYFVLFFFRSFDFVFVFIIVCLFIIAFFRIKLCIDMDRLEIGSY